MLTFTTGMLNTADSTLAQMVAFLSNTCDAEISPQAIDQKINNAGKEFLKACLAKAFALSLQRYDFDIDVLNNFKHVYIIDSTNFDLHPKLKEVFKGNSGAASKSSLRIQFVYDFLSGQMYIQIGDVRLSDAKSLYSIVKECELKIYGPALFLADLGYFKTETFILIDSYSHSFISKLKYDVTLCDEYGCKLDINELLTKCTEIDIKIRIGNLNCRLVGKKLTEQAINEKLRKANREAKKKGRALTEEYKKFLMFGLFITNLENPFTPIILFNLYRLRWQIELIFKTWKSILGIHKIRSAREARVLCEVYGKLIIAALSNAIHWGIKIEYNVVLSYHKVLQYTKAIAVNWTASILMGAPEHLRFISKFTKQILRFCKKNKQKKKPYIEHILEAMELT